MYQMALRCASLFIGQLCAILQKYLFKIRSFTPKIINIEKLPHQRETSPSLQALTAAALALPGLSPTITLADEIDQFEIQYGYYKEGERQIYGQKSRYEPIRVDNIHANGSVSLFDRLKLSFGYIQDTWTGATPITTAPLAFGGNNISETGASPFIQSGNLFFDKNLNPYRLDLDNFRYIKDTRLEHTISSASPETRKQGDFKLAYQWDRLNLDLGGGLSQEHDYDSWYVNSHGRWDFNQKLTTLSWGISFTDNDIAAVLDPNMRPYIDDSYYISDEERRHALRANLDPTITGNRQDWSFNLGLSQILNKTALVEASFGYTHSSGFLENPYKVVEFVFLDPNEAPEPEGTPEAGLFRADVHPVVESRPDTRNQWSFNTQYVQHIEQFNAALHLDYRFFHDDWDINAHTFEATWGQPLGEGWTVTPRIRYYTQNEADFYQPYFLFQQAKPKKGFRFIDFDKLPIKNYSSDHRLSGYGALSGGVTITKQFVKGVTLEAGVEYYTHQGELKLGGGGEESFADYDSYLVNAALKVDLSSTLALPSMAGDSHTGHSHHQHHDHSLHAYAPAGVMFDHMMPNPGDFMLGYYYRFDRSADKTLYASASVSDKAIVQNACGKTGCAFTPEEMTMHMHMFDIMYAATDWLNFMAMPMFMDMEMTLRPLAGGVIDPDGGHHHHGASASHMSGGLGDIPVYALFKLFDLPGHHLHLGLGINFPTGQIDIKSNSGNLLHYHMQLGSGTWDLLPNLTYTGQRGHFSWGAQISGVKRLQDANGEGYSLGDIFSSTAWGSYQFNNWLSTSARAVYTAQSAITGEFAGLHDESTPPDLPFNYGGQFWDVGVGLTAVVPSGQFKGNRLSLEWLEPVVDNPNGYQLERQGTLAATWSIMF